MQFNSTLKKLLIIIIIFFGFCLTNVSVAQSGGRSREHKSKKRITWFKRHPSAGNADKFARGGKRRGFIARLFKISRPAWVYHKTNSSKAEIKETKHLFKRYRLKGKRK